MVHLLAPDYQSHVESTLIHGSRVTKVGGLELSNTSGSISTFTVDFKSVYWEQVHGKNVPNGKIANIIGAFNDDTRRNANLGAPGSDGDANLATNDDTNSRGGLSVPFGSRYGGPAFGAYGNSQAGVGGPSGNNFGPLSRYTE